MSDPVAVVEVSATDAAATAAARIGPTPQRQTSCTTALTECAASKFWTFAGLFLVLIIITSLPRLWTLFRSKTDEEKRYFEVTSTQRWTMAILYFGLVAFLVAGMTYTHIAPQQPNSTEPPPTAESVGFN